MSDRPDKCPKCGALWRNECDRDYAHWPQWGCGTLMLEEGSETEEPYIEQSRVCRIAALTAERDALRAEVELYRDLHRAAKKLHKSVWNKGVHEALAALDAAGVKAEEVSGE